MGGAGIAGPSAADGHSGGMVHSPDLASPGALSDSASDATGSLSSRSGERRPRPPPARPSPGAPSESASDTAGSWSSRSGERRPRPAAERAAAAAGKAKAVARVAGFVTMRSLRSLDVEMHKVGGQVGSFGRKASFGRKPRATAQSSAARADSERESEGRRPQAEC